MRMRRTTLVLKAAQLLSAAGLIAASGAGWTAPLAIPNDPLFLTTGVKPNIIMAVDDSGSMDGEMLFTNNDGAAWWRTSEGGGCPRGFIGCGTNGSADVAEANRLNFNHAGGANGTWKKYVYLFPIGTGEGNRVYSDDTNDHFAIPPLPSFAWARSPSFNTAYFDPTVTYEPWQSYGSTSFPAASPTAARTDPVRGAATFDLTLDRMSGTSVASTTCSGSTPALSTNHQFRMYPGMVIPSGTCYRVDGGGDWQIASSDLTIAEGGHAPASLTTTATGGGIGVAIKYFPATFYLRSTVTLPASYGYTASPVIEGSGPAGETLHRYDIKRANFASDPTYEAAIQNFANWWTYYRKRHLATRGGIGSAFAEVKQTRVGSFRINNRDTVSMRDLDVTSDRDSFYTTVYNYVGSGGTPNRESVHHMGLQYNRTDASAPITAACQKNFGILFTDGYSNASTPASVGNRDGGMGSPFADNVSNTTADYATNVYLNPLRSSDMAQNRVSVPSGCSVATPDPRLDCVNDLHMNFYAVTLGTKGQIFETDLVRTNDPYANPPSWPTTFTDRHPSSVDDLWHATLNTRGEMLNAKTPKEIGDKLSAVLRSISERTASASSASVNSGSINSDTRVFQARFNSTYWTGELLSFSINAANGALAGQAWDASEELPDPDDRQIITVDANGDAVPFRWNRIGTTRQNQLDADATRGERILNYLRGDATYEGTAADQFRPRQDADGPNKLGDIVSSAPVFVGRPAARYRDSLESSPYSTFAANNADRQGMVYVGANDGMLHGFNANNGEEVFAFIPTPVFSRLRNLASPTYAHQFYVDGSPSTADVYFTGGGGGWRTVLAGGLNKGGQGVYALNITDPTTLAAAENGSNASNILLWEFTDADDSDLGYTYSQPVITKLRNGRWAAVFGNGYNSKTADDHPSASGNAVLYIVDIQNGSLLARIDTGVGSDDAPSGVTYDNGLSTPNLVDTNGDRVAEYAYAGDLYGNLWKFDLTSTNAAAWRVAYTDTDGDPIPLFRATDDSSNSQPITIKPTVTRGPAGAGMIVLFGTGKFLENSDKLLSPERRQTFYGIVDRNTGTASDVIASRATLQRQTITRELTFDPDGSGPLASVGLRITTTHGATADGWFMDLVSPSGYEAEKLVTNPIIRDDRIIFTTLIPSTDPCSAGGESWLMELSVLAGARLNSPPFDLNKDGLFDNSDKPFDTDGTTLINASGLQGTEGGIWQAPGILEGETGGGGGGGGGNCIQYKYLPDSNGNITIVNESCGPGGDGRQSWRQIR